MTGLSACTVMAASTAHRAECQLGGRTQRYKIHMVQFGSEKPKCFHTAVWANPTAPLYDQLQQVNAVNNTPMSSLPPREYLHTQPFQCWFTLSVSLSFILVVICFLFYSSQGLPPTPSLPSSSTCHQQVRALEAILLCIKMLLLHLHRPCGIFPNASERREASEGYQVSVLILSSLHPVH